MRARKSCVPCVMVSLYCSAVAVTGGGMPYTLHDKEFVQDSGEP